MSFISITHEQKMSLPDVDHTFLCLWHVWIRSEIHHFYAEKWKHVVIQLLTFGRSDINQIRIDVSFMDLLFLYVGLNILFSSNHNRLKGLKHKNKGHTNFYECCDLTEKVYLMYTLLFLFKIYSLCISVLQMMASFHTFRSFFR